MPRPTVAQLVYGTITVVCSAVAMLLLTGAESQIAVFAICFTALGIGLLVAVTTSAPRRRAAEALPEARLLPRVPRQATPAASAGGQERAVAGRRDAA